MTNEDRERGNTPFQLFYSDRIDGMNAEEVQRSLEAYVESLIPLTDEVTAALDYFALWKARKQEHEAIRDLDQSHSARRLPRSKRLLLEKEVDIQTAVVISTITRIEKKLSDSEKHPDYEPVYTNLVGFGHVLIDREHVPIVHMDELFTKLTFRINTRNKDARNIQRISNGLPPL